MQAALVRVEGFKRMRADVIAERVEVVYDPRKADPAMLTAAINSRTSYRASIVPQPAASAP